MLLSNLNLLATAPGGVARLRELILTLAVQGKLVAQDPRDEPASELLKKIRAEKDRLIAAGKIKRDKPLAGIAEEEKSFGLPHGWEWVRLGSLIELVSGQHLGPNEYVEGLGGGIPYLTGPAEFGATSPEPSRSTRERRAVAIQNDILVTVKGSGVGKLNLVAQPEIAISRQLMAIRPISMDYRFLLLVLQTLAVQFQSQSIGIAIPGIGRDDVVLSILGLPPLAEQSRIVTRVEELMRLCDALEVKGQLEATQHAQLVSTLLATLTESETPAQLADNWHRIAAHFDLLLDRPEVVDVLEQTILQLAVRGLLVPQDPQDEPASQLVQRLSKASLGETSSTRRGIEALFVIPNSWCWVSLENLAKSMSNGLYKPAKFYSETGTACVRMYNIQDGHLDFSKLMRLDVTPSELAQYSLEPGDLLINRVNSRELVGKCAVVSAHHEPLVYEAMNIRVRLLELANMPSYVNLVLRTKRVREVFQGDAKQAVGQASINQTQVGGVAIPLPPLAEQSRIVTRVTQLRRLCADLRQRLSASQSTQAYLAEALVQEVA
jgi:type I restriction enzyme S subunit